MTKRIALIAALALLAASAAFAAGVAGRALAVDRGHALLLIDGEHPGWLRKGAAVSVQGSRGRIARIAGDTLDVATPRAAKVKPGDTVQVSPAPRSASGC